MEKKIVMDASCHLMGRCPNKAGKGKRCEGTVLVAITPEQKAEIKSYDVNMGQQKFTCGHVHTVIATF